MYISNDVKQNSYFCKLKLLLKSLNNSSFNQSIMISGLTYKQTENWHTFPVMINKITKFCKLQLLVEKFKHL